MLDPILASVRARLPEVVAAEDELQALAAARPPARDAAAALTGPGLAVIAEVKRQSPSAGSLAPELDPAAQAARYAAGGAAAVSVLTESDHFGGSLGDLRAVRGAVDLPVLRKDFTLHPAQVWEAAAAGADLVLLIAAVLDDGELAALIETADAAGLAALVEVHTADEARRARAADARMVGVNNRDLATFAVDLATAEGLAPLLDGVPVRIAESGIGDADGAARMAAAGYDAVLVGEALVRAADPARLVAEMRAAGG